MNNPVTAENVYEGMKVKPGRDWGWGYQNLGSVYGVVVKDTKVDLVHTGGWVSVKWLNSNYIRNYRVGAYDMYDLQEYESEFVKAVREISEEQSNQ